MQRPRVNQVAYYDGHHHMHCFGFLLAVNGVDGCCRIFNGHFPGSQNDLNSLHSSELYDKPGLYLGVSAKALADGIFRVVPCCVVPVCGVRRDLTVMKVNYNVIQRKGRSIVEHYISRLKESCGNLHHYIFSIDGINPLFIACLCLTNIRVKHQDRLRDR